MLRVFSYQGCLHAQLAKPRQSKALRSLDASVPFDLEMMRGGYAHTERLSMFSILYAKGYSDLGLECEWREDTFSIGDARVAANDGYAEMLADLSVAVVEQHCRRNLVFSHGYPRRQTCLLDAELGPTFVAQLKEDLAIHKLILESDFDGHSSYVARSCFNLASVAQIVKCLESEGWVITARTLYCFCFSSGRVPHVSGGPTPSFRSVRSCPCVGLAARPARKCPIRLWPSQP